jgi:hypothetical protein
MVTHVPVKRCLANQFQVQNMNKYEILKIHLKKIQSLSSYDRDLSAVKHQLRIINIFPV